MEKLNFCGFSGISVKTNSSKTFSGRGHFILGRGTKIGVAFFKAAQSMTILSYRTWYDHFCQISTSLIYCFVMGKRGSLLLSGSFNRDIMTNHPQRSLPPPSFSFSSYLSKKRLITFEKKMKKTSKMVIKRNTSIHTLGYIWCWWCIRSNEPIKRIITHKGH